MERPMVVFKAKARPPRKPIPMINSSKISSRFKLCVQRETQYHYASILSQPVCDPFSESEGSDVRNGLS